MKFLKLNAFIIALFASLLMPATQANDGLSDGARAILEANKTITNINSAQLLKILKENPKTELVDVRSPDEVDFIGGYIDADEHVNITRGWLEFAQRLAEHSSQGSAFTMKGVQARRPSLYDLEEELRSMSVPTLIVNGDEDDHCLQVGIYLKKVIPASGLLVLPKTGHTLNLECPEAFNRALSEFLTLVSNEKWLPRDPRANPEQVMRTD